MGAEIVKTVYLTRHAQSLDNVSHVYQSPKSPLSKEGHQQAAVLAKRLSVLDFEALVSSPLTRAEQTTDHIEDETGIIPVFSELFVERIKPTSIEGLPHNDFKATQIWQAWLESLYTDGLRIEDGENFQDIIERSDQALDELKDNPARSIVVITHGHFLRALLARVLIGDELTGSIMKRFHDSSRVENASISVLQYMNYGNSQDYHWRLDAYNDHSHFD